MFWDPLDDLLGINDSATNRLKLGRYFCIIISVSYLVLIIFDMLFEFKVMSFILEGAVIAALFLVLLILSYLNNFIIDNLFSSIYLLTFIIINFHIYLVDLSEYTFDSAIILIAMLGISNLLLGEKIELLWYNTLSFLLFALNIFLIAEGLIMEWFYFSSILVVSLIPFVVLVLSLGSKTDRDENVNKFEFEKELRDKLKQEKEFFKQEREFLRKIIDLAPNLIFVKDIKGKFVLVNTEFAKLYGYQPEDLVGKSDRDLFNDQQVVQKFRHNDQEVIKRRERRVVPEGKIIDAQGKQHWLYTVKVPLALGDKKQIYILGISTDITERKEFELALARKTQEKEILLENIDIQVWYLKDRYTYGAVNDAHAKFFGATKEELQNQKVCEFRSEEIRERCINGNYEVFETKEQIQYEHCLENSQGEKRMLFITKAPKLNQSGEVEYVVCMARDITEQKEAEEELEYRTKLEALITDLSTHFINLNHDEIDREINFALKRLGEFSEIDRSSIFIFSENKDFLVNTHEWTAGDIDPLDESFKEASVKALPWLLEQLDQFRVVNLRSLSELPIEAESERIILRALNVKSAIFVPLITCKSSLSFSLLGFLAFMAVDETKELSEEIIELLQIVGDMLVNALEQKWREKKLNNYTMKLELATLELETTYTKLNDEIEKAKELHKQFLPGGFPQLEGLEMAAHYHPAESLGGDFYNVFRFGNKLIIYMVDITGHGLDGAMLNIFVRESINSFLLAKYQKNEELSPSKIIEFIFKRYCQESFPDDYFICLLLAILDLDSMEFTFSNAGFQVPPLLVKSNGELEPVLVTGLPISDMIDDFLFNHRNINEEKIIFEQGSTFLLATDGLIEESVDYINMYGEQRLERVFKQHHYLGPELVIEAINEDFKSFAGTIQGQDDITFMVIQRDFEVVAEFSESIKSKLEIMYELRERIAAFIIPYYEGDISSLMIGLQEILINAMEHGNRLISSKEVRIEVQITDQYIKIVVEDEGEGFDWKQRMHKKLELNSEQSQIKDRGRGIILTKMAYDNIYYNDSGNQVTLIKLR